MRMRRVARPTLPAASVARTDTVTMSPRTGRARAVRRDRRSETRALLPAVIDVVALRTVTTRLPSLNLTVAAALHASSQLRLREILRATPMRWRARAAAVMRGGVVSATGGVGGLGSPPGSPPGGGGVVPPPPPVPPPPVVV